MEPVREPQVAAAERGVTFVETLLSLLLLSLVVLGSLNMVTIASRQNKLAKSRSLATNIAAERLDRLTSQKYCDAASYTVYKLAEETASAGPPKKLTTAYGQIPGYPEFRRVVTLNYDTPIAGILRAKVEVFWKDLQQGEKRHQVLTFVEPDLETR